MMSATLTTAAAQVAAILAALPARNTWDCQEQDLEVARVLEILQTAVEGNGDSWQYLQECVENIKAQVNIDRAREAA
jgi:hypothetical protein